MQFHRLGNIFLLSLHGGDKVDLIEDVYHAAFNPTQNCCDQ